MLRFVKPGHYLVGVPARDLGQQDIEALGLDAEELVASGLYEEVDGPESPDGSSEGGES